VDLLYHIAGKIKTVRDISFDKEKDENGNEASPAKSKSKSKTPSPAEDEEMTEEGAEPTGDDNKDPNVVSYADLNRLRADDQNLYALSELTQLIIRNKATQHGWAISTYPEKVRLPSDIFHNLTNPQAVNDVSVPIFGKTIGSCGRISENTF
jgi:hypothetical protein